MKECFVTGGTGHVGNVLIRKLVDEGFLVTALVLPNEDLTCLQDLPVRVVSGNVLDKEVLRKEIKEGGLVFHLAAIIDIGAVNKKMLYNVNVNGTKNIVDVCLEKKVKKLIYTSTVHTVDPDSADELLEPTVFDEKNVKGHYAKSKTIAARYVFDKVKEGLNAVVLYPSGIIGPYDNKVSNLGKLVTKVINNSLNMCVKGKYNLVDVRDVVEGIYNAITLGKVGEGYLLSGYVIDVCEIFDTVKHVLNRDNKTIIMPMWLVKMACPFAELYYKLFGKTALFTRYSMYTITSNCNFNNSKAKNDLQINFRHPKESFTDAVHWFIDNKPELIKPTIRERIKKLGLAGMFVQKS